jgi:lipopolysaccharide transport system ATP-binding protein
VISIKFENISKQYRLGLVSTKTLSHDLNRWWQTNVLGKEDPYLKIGEINNRETKGTSEYVWALRDISFEVEQGDVLGIIGKNGAGKSTLLKILSKVTSPTTGSIKARGRIASLLEVGTGFHPEMTGRENIYMNGAIMGMTKAEISRKLDEIVDFSGVERYLDTPVKRYSSGMTVRLGFAIAAHLDPEILVVDEVLAVGDAEFQKKAIGKMQDVSRGEGRTVLFVSHNMASLQNLCTKGVLLENGTLKFQSTIDKTIEEYMSLSSDKQVGGVIDEKVKRTGNGKAIMKSIRMLNSDNEEIYSFKMGEDIVVEMQIQVFSPLKNLDINVRMDDVHNVKVAGWRTGETLELNEKRDFHVGVYTVRLLIKDMNVFDGMYNLSYSLTDGSELYDYIGSVVSFEIIPGFVPAFKNKIIAKSYNLIYTPCDWEFNKLSPQIDINYD